MENNNQISLRSIFSDGMVLQRDLALKIRGRAAPEESLEIEFRGETYSVLTDQGGHWQLKLPPLGPGGPFEMVIRGDSERRIKDILVGDVWHLAGQSNMELPVNRVLDLYEDEAAEACNPLIRQFRVPTTYDFHGPRSECTGSGWLDVTPQNVLEFSALGYFFAQAYQKKYGVPVGLVLSAVGGTPIEAWLSPEVIERVGGYEQEVAQCKDDDFVQETIRSEEARTNRWYADLDRLDEGMREGAVNWFEPQLDHSPWKSLPVPGIWRSGELARFSGVVWALKTVRVSQEMLEYPALLRLGALVDGDQTYLNGTLVGQTDYRYPPRKYPIPPGVLRAGSNTIAVRLIVNRGSGGFVENKKYQLEMGPHRLDLSGSWHYQKGASLPPLPRGTFFKYKPSGVYNGMIAPLKDYAFRGVLWYQGESNTQQPERYEALFRELIADWRRTFNQADLPFLFVQLANYKVPPGDSTPALNWAELREAQAAVLDIPHTGMAVAIDLGEENDLHPQNKKDLAERIFLAAQKVVHAEQVLAQGPTPLQLKIEDDSLELSFSHVGEGLEARGGKPGGLEICTSEGEFFEAEGVIIDQSTIRIKTEPALRPSGVRYAWADHPQGANLYNSEGLPAPPFRIFV